MGEGGQHGPGLGGSTGRAVGVARAGAGERIRSGPGRGRAVREGKPLRRQFHILFCLRRCCVSLCRCCVYLRRCFLGLHCCCLCLRAAACVCALLFVSAPLLLVSARCLCLRPAAFLCALLLVSAPLLLVSTPLLSVSVPLLLVSALISVRFSTP